VVMAVPDDIRGVPLEDFFKSPFNGIIWSSPNERWAEESRRDGGDFIKEGHAIVVEYVASYEVDGKIEDGAWINVGWSR